MPEPEPSRHEKLIDHSAKPLPAAWLTRTDAAVPTHTRETAPQGLWESGPEGAMRKEAVGLIRRAESIVCLSSFLLADKEVVSALLDQARLGTRVYVLTGSEKRLKTEPREDSEFDQKVFEEHKAMLDSLAGRALLRSGEALHAKYLVVDPMGSRSAGMLFTANLTPEALTRNLELAVSLEQQEILDLFALFRWGFWRQSGYELFEPGRLETSRPSGLFNIPKPIRLAVTSSDSLTLKQQVERLVRKSKNGLFVTCFGFDQEHPSTEWIHEAAQAGRDVRVIARVRPRASHMGALLRLVEGGAKVRGHPYIHAKTILTTIDGKREALVMSANLEPHGLDEGYEAGVLLRGERAKSLEGILEHWWEEAPVRLNGRGKRGDVEGEVQLYVEDQRGGKALGRFEKAVIVKEYHKDLGVMEGAPKLTPPEQSGIRTLYHRETYTWQTLASRTPSPTR